MERIQVLSHTPTFAARTLPIASSKSESNRALIIQQLASQPIELENLSEARDTQTMLRLLNSTDTTLDVLDAGTTMRFLTAFCTVTNRQVTLTGTARMQERPIGILVEALRHIGSNIRYTHRDGYPPFSLEGFAQKSAHVRLRGDVSSQYISALLMIAPTLPQGLSLELEGTIGSRPYIEMTLALMKQFGVAHRWEGQTIHVAPQPYRGGTYRIESDWSGASYWYSLVALAESGSLTLLGLREHSLQGDAVIAQIMAPLGVRTTFHAEGATLTKIPPKTDEPFSFDFAHCPDLAQTVSVVCAALGIEAHLTGLASLRIKETDRIAALEQELGKMGVSVRIAGDDALHIPATPFNLPPRTRFATYEDHRMAMAFAPLATRQHICIENPDVVHKSYPSFWAHLQQVGVGCEEQAG